MGMELMFDPEKQAQHEKEEEQLALELKGLVEKSFKNHATQGNENQLSKEEAHKFFENFASEQALFLEGMMKKAIVAGFNAEVKPKIEAGMLEGKNVEEFKAEMKGNCAQALEQIKAKVNEMVDSYNQVKEERNAAAFKVADTNGDGTLNLDELQAMLTPNEPLNERFL